MAIKAAFYRSQERLKNCFPVFQHVDIPKTEDRPTIRDHETIPRLVIAVVGMLTAVDFHDKLALPAGKIGKIAAYRKLPHEFVAIQSAVAQFEPKGAFGIVIRLTQASCSFRCRDFWSTHALPLTLTLSP